MLKNSFYKLNNKSNFNVVYFGGSITDGAGVSTYEKCWAGRISSWLSENFPSCRINSFSAAIGGTSSSLGVYRCEKDVLSKNPDLVFIEFSVNDHGTDYDTVLNNHESILKKIYSHNPTTDVIIVFVTTQGLYEDIKDGCEILSRSAASAAADYYGVMQIDAGSVLAKEVETKANGRWGEYLGDSIHPTDKGYEIYYKAIAKSIGEQFESYTEVTDLTEKALPEPIFKDNSYANAHLVDSTEAEYDGGWQIFINDQKIKAENDYTKQDRYLKSTTPGSTLSFKFEGSQVGIFWAMDNFSGKIEFSVDGSERKTVSAWDFHCAKFSRDNYVILAENLPVGSHTLTVTVSEEKNPASLGHTVRIGYFMVS